jgi:tRNA (guanine-N7-)-methyltransferase
MARVRVHQHVNPLSPYYVFEPNPIALEAVFTNPNLPIHLDIGCARGRFILKMAQTEKAQNFLGVEIREPLVIEGNRLAKEQHLDNLHYEFCNAMVALDKLLEKIPAGLLQIVTIQFPDPWFKKKHAKRRMVNAELVETVVEKLAENGKIKPTSNFSPRKCLNCFAQAKTYAKFQPKKIRFPSKPKGKRRSKKKTCLFTGRYF